MNQVNKDDLETEISKLSFMKRGENENQMVVERSINKESNRILEAASRMAANENYALFGDQVKFNTAVSNLVGWMNENRSEAIGEAAFSELVQFARQFTKVVRGNVHNSQSYVEAAASLGIAAECASKEDKQ